jgi:hypothetical protein
VPVLALLADWALWLRVHQHGWTPERIWGAVVGLLVTIHAVGYACSHLLRGRWMSALPATNIVAAVLEVAIIAALISPMADARKLAVASQVARLKAGVVDVDAFDWKFLQRGAGPYGRAGLQALAAADGQDERARHLVQRASEALSSENIPSATDQQNREKALATLRERVTVLPQGAVPEASLLERLARPYADWDERQCLSDPKNCELWLVDLDRDGQMEAVLLWGRNGSVQATLYAKEANGWRKQGALKGGPQRLNEWSQAIVEGHVDHATPKWPDLLVNGTRVIVVQ